MIYLPKPLSYRDFLTQLSQYLWVSTYNLSLGVGGGYLCCIEISWSGMRFPSSSVLFLLWFFCLWSSFAQYHSSLLFFRPPHPNPPSPRGPGVEIVKLFRYRKREKINIIRSASISDIQEQWCNYTLRGSEWDLMRIGSHTHPTSDEIFWTLFLKKAE